jgi:hypothetical protein
MAMDSHQNISIKNHENIIISFDKEKEAILKEYPIDKKLTDEEENIKNKKILEACDIFFDKLKEYFLNKPKILITSILEKFVIALQEGFQCQKKLFDASLCEEKQLLLEAFILRHGMVHNKEYREFIKNIDFENLFIENKINNESIPLSNKFIYLYEIQKEFLDHYFEKLFPIQHDENFQQAVF